MKEHECDKATDIAVIKKTVERLDKSLNGNGRKGLLLDVSELGVMVKTQHDSIEELKIIVSGLAKFTAEQQGAQKKEFTIFQKIIAVVTIVVAFGSLVLGIVQVFI